MVNLDPSLPAIGLLFIPIEIYIIGGSIGTDGITTFLFYSFKVLVTIALLNPAIYTISPATALFISIYIIPYLLNILNTLDYSTTLPSKSIAVNLSFTLTSP